MSDNLLIKGFTIITKNIIGQGAYGVVFKVIDSKGNKVATKWIDIAGHSLPNIVNDVEKIKHLNHPNIIKVYDIYQDDKAV